ncbi:MAG: fatty acid cis/trans isomerase, partial [Thermodesulfobacteriota bacterium]
CLPQAPPPVVIEMPYRKIDYLSEVKPILDMRCVVCHSCYNSPCQLKLSSFEGVDRGGSKKAVYQATRLTTMDPTRLFIDAMTTKEWREKDFFSVTESKAQTGYNNSIMLQLLSHKMKNPKSIGDYHSEDEDLTCSETDIELGGYLKKHPNRGMPFGFPPLTEKEFGIIAGWLAQGAKGPDAEKQKILTAPASVDVEAIQQWEAFLNQNDPKHIMTSRYLFEHLFLAHIKFGTTSNIFYELIRSKTPAGQPVELINTVRPYDSPGVDKFYYRFRKIHSTIVHKTHMVFLLDEAKMTRFKEIFIEPTWLLKPHIVGYEQKNSANPFVSFEQIPPRSRYQFLLDNAHYIIMTFIRGPVCRGQVALDVIQDHFWVMFLDPEHDLSVQYPAFLKLQQKNLIMPIDQGSHFPVSKLINNQYHQAVLRYFKERQNFYLAHHLYTDGLGYDSIWKGSKASDASLLTVYRHFDSASVHRGVLGELPKTMWVIDYPLFERIYYALVAGFDVYGTLGHQLAVRLYMDTLRVEGETYFLDFLPEQKRKELMQSWYKGVDFKDIHTFPGKMATKIDFSTNAPKREFIESIVNNQILPSSGIGFDPINYFYNGQEHPPLPEQYKTLNDYLQGLRAISKPESPFFAHFNDHNLNLAYLRIRTRDSQDIVISMIVNRWHDNVTYLFSENKELNSAKDRADFIEGFIGSYPNYFFDVHEDDFPDFLDLLSHFHGGEKDMDRLRKYGINRANDDFWKHYDWFQQQFKREQPINAGLFDLNRYYFKATGEQQTTLKK